jgi:sugar phosphate isomerase/epimerase
MNHNPSPATDSISRRQALKTVAISALALPLLGTNAFAAEAAGPAIAPAKEKLRLGVASYSTRMMSVDDTLSTLKVLRITNCGLFKTHLPWESATPEEARAIADKFHAAGIALTGSGVINLPNSEAELRKAFENAKAAQLATMVCKPTPDAFPLLEKFVKEYDQRLAIHNHGPEDKLYPSPYDAWKAVQSLDSRIGLCIDVGHAMRANADPAEAIRKCASRLYDLHMKDSNAVPGTIKDIPAEVGAGRMDIKSILTALLAIKYSGVVSFEYEKVSANPVTGLAESVGYVRGMLAAMNA